MEKGRISSLQFFILVSMFIISSSTLLIPTVVTKYAEQDGWISGVVGVIVSQLLIWIYVVLGKRNPDLTIIQYSEKVFGKYVGKFTSLLFCIYFLIISGGLLRQLGDFITSLVLPETPLSAVELLMMVIIVTAVRLGLETFSRAAEILFPWVMMFILLLAFTLLPNFEWKNTGPFFEEGFPRIIRGAINIVGIPYLDLVIFLVLFPYVSEMKKAGKVYFAAGIFGGLILIVSILFCIFILGAKLTSFSVYPVYMLAQKVNVGNFIQRIEILVGGIWFITLFFKITICFYASVLGIAQLCGVKQYKFLTVPLGIIVMCSSMLMFPNNVYFFEMIAHIWTPSVLLYGLIIPLILLIVQPLKARMAKSGKETADGTR